MNTLSARLLEVCRGQRRNTRLRQSSYEIFGNVTNLQLTYVFLGFDMIVGKTLEQYSNCK
jgi:hypothetical protein